MNKTRSKILEELSKNCRISTTKLAKIIGSPRHIVAYHRKQLEKTGTIIKHHLVVNYAAIGLSEYICYLKIFQFSIIKDEFCDFVSQHPNVRWFSSMFPQYSVRVVLIVKDEEELDEFIDYLDQQFGKHITERQVIRSKGYLKHESYATGQPKKPLAGPFVPLTDQERQLVNLLSAAPRSSLLDLATQTGISIETVRQKIRKLIEKGFITSFAAVHDAEKVGHKFWCIALLHVNNLSTHLNTLQSLLYSDVIFGKTRQTFGKWNVEMTLFGESYNKLLATIGKLENLFGDDFAGHSIQVYTDTYVHSRLPKKYF